jgi:hypothetical protein
MAVPRKPRPTIRMAALYMPNGVHPDLWTPSTTGREFTFSPTLQPLADLGSELLVLTNLWNHGSVGGDGHYVKISGFLTSTTVTKTLGVDVSCNGVSVDQLAARHAAPHTPFPSLELGTAPVTTGVDRNVGYTRVYGSHIAWAGPTQPLAKEINPRGAFERLLRATRPLAASATDDKLLLDRVLEDARRLRTGLGAADQQRIDEYLSVVRSLEARIQRTQRPGHTNWKPRVPIDPAIEPPTEPRNYAEHVRLMMDIIALAFQSDSTRVATFMFNNEVSNQNFSFLDGVKDGHHSLSHHQRDPEKLRQYQIINRWHVEQYAYLLRRLRLMSEGETNVLDQSMILFGSGIRDGDRHDPHNLPLLLAGRAGGRLDTGQHLSYSPDTPLANLYVSMLDAFGAPVERFADSIGPLAGIGRSTPTG